MSSTAFLLSLLVIVALAMTWMYVCGLNRGLEKGEDRALEAGVAERDADGEFRFVEPLAFTTHPTYVDGRPFMIAICGPRFRTLSDGESVAMQESVRAFFADTEFASAPVILLPAGHYLQFVTDEPKA